MQYLLKEVKREWLEDGDRLTAGSYNLYLYKNQYKRKKENSWIDFIAGDLKLTFYFRDHPIVIHANDFVSKYTSIQDFIDKLELMIGILEEAIEKISSHDDKSRNTSPNIILKRFLNPDTGCSDIYTSTMAITSSPTHGYTFELASCDHKTRMTLYGKKEAIKFLSKLRDFIKKPKKLCEEAFKTHHDILLEDHQGLAQ